MKANVFSIEEFSVFDGPGIRTTVFFSGCPLRCEWCHNPEGQTFEPFIMRNTNGCLKCGACFKTSKNGKLTDESISVCPQRLLRYSSTEYTPESLAKKILSNADILNASKGGITLSGGEPLCHAEFIKELLRLTDGKVNRAIQTSGYCEPDVFAQILPMVDYMLFDIKIVDEEKHKRYTGKSNKWILENYTLLAKSGKKFVTRTPVIPTVTDTKENFEAIAELLKKNGVEYIELLPYNKAAGAKYAMAGKKYQPSFDEKSELNFGEEIFDWYGIKHRVL